MKLRIKELCKEKGITLLEVSEELGISRETLSRSINGNISLNRLKDIATILKVPVKDLILEDEAELNGIIRVGSDYYELTSKEDLENLLKQI